MTKTNTSEAKVIRLMQKNSMNSNSINLKQILDVKNDFEWILDKIDKALVKNAN